MRAAQTGDRDAFSALFARHGSRVERFLTRMLGDETLAQDVAQSAFCSAWTHRGRFDGRRSFLTWLFAIARNAARNAVARSPARREQSLEENGRLILSAETLVNDTGALVSAVRDALAALPEAQRLCLVLTVYEGYTFREAARVLGGTELAARALAFRARRSLQKTLAPWIEDEVTMTRNSATDTSADDAADAFRSGELG